MATHLNTIQDKPGARTARTRVGRGIGSGKGKTCGRGIKGQKSRSGVAIKGFEGGQMPIHRRLPKRGFNNINRRVYEVINLSDLQQAIDNKKLDGAKSIAHKELIAAGLAHGNKDGIKLLAKGTLKAKVTLTVDKASAVAQAAIEKAGGTLSLAPLPTPEKASKEEPKTPKKPKADSAKKASSKSKTS